MRIREAIALVTLVALTAAPFLDKAYHVDDTLMLRVAENVRIDPFDPFAGTFDFVGRTLPLWTVTTNPPLVSYVLAPVAARSDSDEVALHAVMTLFVLLLAWGVFSLAGRFCGERWWPVLFALTSAGVAPSSNVMQDVPATGLVAAGMAAFVAGSDAADRRRLLAGALIAGFAVLVKYSAAVALPLLALYPLLARRWSQIPWALVALAPLAVWCLHNAAVHGELHLLAVAGRGYGPGVAWRRNLAGVFAVIGSLCYLTPVVLARALARRDRVVLAAAAGLALAAGVGIRAYVGRFDPQHLFWTLTGALLVGACAADALRRALRPRRAADGRDPADSAFLLAWLGAPLAFSVLFPPFQAVRHLIPALPPLVLLAFRHLSLPRGPALRAGLAAALGAQAVVAFVVARADADQADVYRDFAARAGAAAAGRSGQTWFVGHWGWQFYATRAGLRQIHGGDAARPAAGDFLVWPEETLRSPYFREPEDLGLALREVEQVAYPTRLPVRTQHIRHGAGFYALALRPPTVPYRFGVGAPLETFRVFEVLGPARAPRRSGTPRSPGASP